MKRDTAAIKHSMALRPRKTNVVNKAASSKLPSKRIVSAKTSKKNIVPAKQPSKKKVSAEPMNDLLECPVCMTLMYPPIHQCSNGHTICFTCKPKVNNRCSNGHTICFTCKPKVNNRCPICRKELGDIRCLALEKVAERIELPCKFDLFGCREIISYKNSRLEHEQMCSFRPYICPYSARNCSITGDINSLVAHLKEEHSVISIHTSNWSKIINIYKISVSNEAMWKGTLWKRFGHHFYLQFEAFTLGCYPVLMAIMRFMGNQSEADNFRYSLEVGGNERKMTWQGVPRSIRDNYKTIRDSHDGLLIQKSMALYFSGEAQRLKMTCRIWRV